jgi:hypothetical protein
MILTAQFALPQAGGLGGPLPENRNARGGAPPALKPATLPDHVSQLTDRTFRITDGRPLEVAAELLSRKLGVTISFEEAAWISTRDTVRAADIPGNEGVTSINHPRGPLVPRTSTVTITVPPTGPEKRALGPSRIVQTTLDYHSSSKNPGDYRLVQVSESEYSIVVDQVENEAGNKVKQLSPLDIRISFPERVRTLQETLDLIYQSAGSAAHVKLGAFFEYRSAASIRLGANNEVARNVLANALRMPGRNRMSWSLRYDPEMKIHLIYFRPVEAEEAVPGEGARLRPLVWPNK